MTETNGVRGKSRCGSAASSCPSFSAGRRTPFFGLRSRVTSPKAQSVISCSPVNHSSVQAKKMVPARPQRTTLSTCQPSISACSSSEWRIVSMPNSPSMSGPFFREILQPQEISLEVALVVQINVEAIEIDVLRQEIFRRRITRVGKENVRIGLAPDADQLLDKFGYAPDAEPAHHRGRNFVPDEVTEDRGMTGMFRNRCREPCARSRAGIFA